jgi:osmotically-inducible protein OsmY
MKHQPKMTLTAVGALVATLALAGCSREDTVAETRTAENTAVVQGEPRVAESAADASRDAAEATRETTSDAAAATREASREAAQETREAAGNAAEATREAGRDLREAGRDAASEVSAEASDARITTSVNAALARDTELSALRIDVDTEDGRVSLNGTAPTEAAKDRAGELARGVDGVQNVDNQLTVRAPQS